MLHTMMVTIIPILLGVIVSYLVAAAMGKADPRSVGLALDELLAGELRDGRAVMAGLEEGVVLFGRDARQFLGQMDKDST